MSYLFATFLVIWAGLFAYILYWQRQVRDLRSEVQALREVARREQGQP
jgi:CcmD family protein